MTDLLDGFTWAPQGAGDDALDRVEAEFGALPSDYVQVLRRHDGGEGWVGDGSYLVVWPLEELSEANVTLRAKEYVPGVVLIGGDGADNLFGIEFASGSYIVFPAVGLDSGEGETVAESWAGFLLALSRS